MKVQLNTLLFAKTLVRKNVAGSSAVDSKKASGTSTPANVKPSNGTGTDDGTVVNETTPTPAITKPSEDEEEFSSKAQVMTLMTTDVDRVSDFSWHLFSLVGKFPSPSSAT